LIGGVRNDLVANGPLNNGQGNSLTSKLQNAIDKLNPRNPNAGINQLQAFIKQLSAFVNSGQLMQSAAKPFIDAANAAIQSALPGPALLASSPGRGPAGATLSAELLQPIVVQAISHWAANGASAEAVDRLSALPIHVMDLPGLYLGAAGSDAIWLDRDAASHGWSLGAGHRNGMDLLSAVTHEFGHVLGFGHDYHDPVMRSQLIPRADHAFASTLPTLSNNRTLLVGNAFDIVFGRLGADRSVYGQGEGILMGGRTSHDDSDNALTQILDEWSDDSLGYATRVDILRDGTGVNGLKLKKPETVFDDGDFDRLTGSASLDWFFFDLAKDWPSFSGGW
jgi:hypothetical protein